METKRCAYCHKLQRADAHACSRCGHVFVQKRARSSTREWTQPSIPPASPHRAGHYSGLHPEDQPYQSNKIAVHHPLSQDNENWRSSLPEPEHIILPVTDPALRRGANIPEHYDEPNGGREAIHYSVDPNNGGREAIHYSVKSSVEPSAAEFPAVGEPLSYQRRSWILPRRAIPILLAISCIFFLLASSIFAVVLLRKSSATVTARITASPSTLRANDTLTLNGSGFSPHSKIAFTYDANRMLYAANERPLTTQTGEQGSFSLQLQIPRDWSLGQHSIHATDVSANLSVSTTLTLQQPPTTVTPQQTPTVPPATTPALHVSPSTLTITPSTLTFSMAVGQQQPVLKAIILENSGNQFLTWSASVSTNDQGHWLSAAPATGTLGPGGEGYMNAQVNVQGLAPGVYQGTLTFSTGSGSAMQQVMIALTVV